jgi:hypothetical protein
VMMMTRMAIHDATRTWWTFPIKVQKTCWWCTRQCIIYRMNYDVAMWRQPDTHQRSGIFSVVATFW